jgi:hypothetical protein
MPANPAGEADALAVGVLALGVVALGVVAAGVLTGVVAGGLPPLNDGELPQPAARPIRTAHTAARAAAAPVAVPVLFMVVPLLPRWLWAGVAGRHHLVVCGAAALPLRP